MAVVPKTKANLMKCQCIKCPSYIFSCKMKAMPGNVILMMGDMEKHIHAEAMFCAYGKSDCINEEKGCLCGTCAVFKEYEPGKGYFCLIALSKRPMGNC
jgi:hypothetical protein